MIKSSYALLSPFKVKSFNFVMSGPTSCALFLYHNMTFPGRFGFCCGVDSGQKSTFWDHDDTELRTNLKM